MRRRSLGLLAILAVSAGCWRITVTSNAAPSPTVVEKPWQHSFIAGLVPPAEINVKDQCPNGVAKVETVHSPANLLATILTQGIYSPITAKVTCAAN
jgi:hypothetical protein